MKVKLLELRDEGTFIPLLCVDMNPTIPESPYGTKADPGAQRYLLRRCGYPCDGEPNIAITHLSCDGMACSNDSYFWSDRTYAVAHRYIIEHWADLKDGDVIDVQFILGETKEPKVSERFIAKAMGVT
jgi:hypothetical protein